MDSNDIEAGVVLHVLGSFWVCWERAAWFSCGVSLCLSLPKDIISCLQTLLLWFIIVFTKCAYFTLLSDRHILTQNLIMAWMCGSFDKNTWYTCTRRCCSCFQLDCCSTRHWSPEGGRGLATGATSGTCGACWWWECEGIGDIPLSLISCHMASANICARVCVGLAYTHKPLYML